LKLLDEPMVLITFPLSHYVSSLSYAQEKVKWDYLNGEQDGMYLPLTDF